jgi:hypothetical protein
MLIKSKYVPRKWFMPFHLRATRWAILVAHRRAGKTVAAINDTVEKASRNTRPNPRYAYVCPLLRQAKDVAWQYLKEAAAPFNPKISESALYVELSALPNSPRITLYGADNPDSFRGQYFDGLVLDEFGNMTQETFTEVLLPALVDRRGWCVLMGTPNGPNHFRDAYYKRKSDPGWFTSLIPVTDTGVIPEDDLREMRDIMDPEQYAQEMLCSFEASVRGAIYARQMEVAQSEGRISAFPVDKYTPVDVVMDLGYRDATAMVFAQARPDGLLMAHAHSDNMRPISHYIQYIKDYFARTQLKAGTIWLPHDARAKSLQTGKSIIDAFRSAGMRPRLVPELDLLDGIEAARKMFPVWYFQERECEGMLLALKSYHRKYDTDRRVFINEPVHDWASHCADAFRYASIALNIPDVKAFRDRRNAPQPVDKDLVPRQAYCLNDIWDTAPRPSARW